jgi:hypothetical protein
MSNRVKGFLHPLGLKMGPTVQSAMVKETTEKTTPKTPGKEIPVEQTEEAEQDATDPTHEKEIPPKK